MFYILSTEYCLIASFTTSLQHLFHLSVPSFHRIRIRSVTRPGSLHLLFGFVRLSGYSIHILIRFFPWIGSCFDEGSKKSVRFFIFLWNVRLFCVKTRTCFRTDPHNRYLLHMLFFLISVSSIIYSFHTRVNSICFYTHRKQRTDIQCDMISMKKHGKRVFLIHSFTVLYVLILYSTGLTADI